MLTMLVGSVLGLTHPSVHALRPHDDSFLAQNGMLFLQELVDFVLSFVTWFLMVQLHEVFLELLDGLLLLDLHSHVLLELSTGLEHSHVSLDLDHLF